MADPLKGEKKEWTIVRARDGGIGGVVSSSTEEPLKQANFPKGLEKFAVAKSYTDWIFEYVPLPVPVIPKAPGPSPQPVGPPTLRTF